MHDIFLHTTTVFMGFFAILNPVGNLPVFLGMVEGCDRKLQMKIARKAVVSAFFIIAFFSLFGHLVFRMFGITLPAFEIAGGIIVFIIGYQLLNAMDTTLQHDSGSKSRKNRGPTDEIGIMPLGIPLLAGPGTISTAMNFVGSQKSFLNVLLVVGVFGVICIITYFLFIFGNKITARLNPSMLKITSRIMGLILAVIAVQMMINGLHGAFELFNKA
jgi:multiple antibiotic resistance protein